MIRLSEVADHLKKLDMFRKVGTAKSYGALTAAQIVWPSAWVLPLTERSGENRYMTNKLPVAQSVKAGFAVVLAVRDIADRSSAKALTEMELVRPAVIEALARFQPTGAQSTCIHRTGAIVSAIAKDGRMLWQDNFEVAFDRQITN